MTKRIVVLGIVFLLSLQGWANAADWYVDPVNGNDTTGTGTYSAPYKTITNLWPHLKSGNNVGLFSGNYGEFNYYMNWISTNAPDIFTNWVTFKALDPQNPPVFQHIKMGYGIQSIVSGPTEPPVARTAAYLAFENLSISNGVMLINVKNIRIKGCRITRQMDAGFVNIDPSFPATNYVENLERIAVSLKRVENFYLENCEVTSAPHGITASGRNINIISNEIHHLRHDGLRIWGCWDSVVEGNRIYNLDALLTDAEANALYPPNAARHADTIQVGIEGAGPINTNVVIRNNVLYDTAAIHIQFNTYGALQNYNFLIEGNIFGPSTAPALNNGALNMTVRNNTFCVLPAPRILNEGSRTNAIIVGTNVIRQAGPQNNVYQNDSALRISPYGNGAKVYNNMLGSYSADAGVVVDLFDYNVLQINSSVTPMGVDDTRAFGRFTVVDTNSPLQNPAAFDGVLRSNATQVINAGTHLIAPINFPDVVGTPRDNRPDLGAWELPGQNPNPDTVPPQIADLKTVFIDDFEDGHYKDVDPWLSGTNTQGMSWYRPAHLTNSWEKFFVSSDWSSTLDRNMLSGASVPNIPRVSWLISEQGTNWSDYAFEFDCDNQYVTSNSGPTVLTLDYKNAYWLDISYGSGRLIRMINGVETVLATNSAIQMPRLGKQHYRIDVNVETNGIAIAVAVGGAPALSYTDTDSMALYTFPAGGVGVHSDLWAAYSKMRFDNIRVAVSKFSDGSSGPPGPPPPPVAAFSASPLSGNAPLAVTFTDSSTGSITNRYWDFGDGTTSNTAVTSLGHTYSSTGTYTVALTVSGPSGANTKTQSSLITVNPPAPPSAAFSASPLSGNAPLAVTFTDSSTGSITNRLWNFGDGTTTNTVAISMGHTYSSTGTYTVALTLSGPFGSDTQTKVNLISAFEPPPDNVRVVTASANDQEWYGSNSVTAIGNGLNSATARTGSQNLPILAKLVIPFQLPALPVGQSITNVSLSVFMTASYPFGGTSNYYVDVYAGRTSASSVTVAGDWDYGTMVGDNLARINPSPLQTNILKTVTLTASYFQNIYSTDPAAAGKYIFLTLGPDRLITVNSIYVTWATGDNTTLAKPTLTITTTAPVGGPAVPPPPASLSFSGSFGNGQDVLSWTTVQGSGYVYGVWYSTNLLNDFLPLQTNLADTVKSLTNLINAPSVFYKIGVQ